MYKAIIHVLNIIIDFYAYNIYIIAKIELMVRFVPSRLYLRDEKCIISIDFIIKLARYDSFGIFNKG